MNYPEYIKQVLRFPFSRLQREEFRRGILGCKWMGRYPHLFDSDDLRIYRNQCEGGYHFFEWLASVLAYEATGHRTLMEKYNAIAHPGKRKQFRQMVPTKVFNALEKDCSGQPDLFVYAPDLQDWHFSEVKGPGDKLRKNQHRQFRRLYELSGKPVHVITFERSEV